MSSAIFRNMSVIIYDALPYWYIILKMKEANTMPVCMQYVDLMQCALNNHPILHRITKMRAIPVVNWTRFPRKARSKGVGPIQT
jgi:hypothetical protein